MLEELKVVEMLSSGYRPRNMLAAIKASIKHADIPINVHCTRLQAATANNHFLDLVKRTRRNFRRECILNNFSPDDRHSGEVFKWLEMGRKDALIGYGEIDIRLFDGKDIHHVQTKNLVIGRWIVSAGIICVRPRIELISHNSQDYLNRHRVQISCNRQRPVLRSV